MNAINSPFVRCLMKDGEFNTLSIMDMLENEHVVCMTGSDRDNFSTLRFILALCGWATPCAAFFDPKAVVNYLRQNESTFDLFNASRFLQGKRTEGKQCVGELLEEVPCGNTVNFMGGIVKAVDKQYGFCPSCCLRGLLRQPAFTTAGGGGKDKDGGAKGPSINGTPPMYVYPVGPTLRDTISLNWQQTTMDDKPTWDNWPNWLNGKVTKTVGFVESFTWRPRLVYLYQGEPGECHVCGEFDEKLVRECYYKTARKEEKGWQKKFWTNDPHVMRRMDGKKEVAFRTPDPIDSPIDRFSSSLRFAKMVLEFIFHGADKLFVKTNTTIPEGENLVVNGVFLNTESGKLKVYDEQAYTVRLKPDARQNPQKYIDLLECGDLNEFLSQVDVNCETPTKATPTNGNGVRYNPETIDSFIQKLSRLTQDKLDAIKDCKMRLSQSSKAFRVFGDLYKNTKLSGKRRPLLVAMLFAHYPQNGKYVLSIKDKGHIGFHGFYQNMLKEVMDCRSRSTPINWAALLVDLYRFTDSVR